MCGRIIEVVVLIRGGARLAAVELIIHPVCLVPVGVDGDDVCLLGAAPRTVVKIAQCQFFDCLIAVRSPEPAFPHIPLTDGTCTRGQCIPVGIGCVRIVKGGCRRHGIDIVCRVFIVFYHKFSVIFRRCCGDIDIRFAYLGEIGDRQRTV